MITEHVHIDNIIVGDTCVIDGKETTINASNIRHDKFMGTSLFGDNYKSGTVLIERVLFPKWSKGELLGYFSQI